MLLTLDIGNTNIKIAAFKGKRVLFSQRLSSNKKAHANQCRVALKKIFTQHKIKPSSIQTIIICSVVPRLSSIFSKTLFSLCKRQALLLGKDVIVPIKNRYKKPHQVGQDRLVNALAAVRKYGRPVIVVDFGTALTFDVISRKGEYLGGVIVPGVEIALEALIQQASLLPRVSLVKPAALLGRETSSSMRSGLVYGYSFLVEGILKELKRTLKVRTQAIATGGAASLICRHCPSINKVDQNLTLEGLKIIYENIIKSKKQRK